MNNGRMTRVIAPIGGIGFSSIILAVARIILCIYVLGTDPLSPGFGYLIVLLFCISVTRHLFLYFNKVTPDNILIFFLTCLLPAYMDLYYTICSPYMKLSFCRF